MPSRAHGYLTRVSIALIVLLTGPMLTISSLNADDIANRVTDDASSGQWSDVKRAASSLPPIGNTTDMDRFLSREVSDDFVFGQAPENAIAVEQTDLQNKAQTNLQTGGKTDEQTAGPAATLLPETLEAAETATDDGAESTPTENPIRAANYNQRTPLDPWLPVFNEEPDASATVWDRIEKSDRLPLAKHERVRFYEEQYQRESLWISKILHRGKPFLAHLVATLDQRFMPLELALLPAIESGYQPTAKSAGQAAGLWQIVPITAKEIGVERGEWFDGRSDILVSTTAAIDYLSYLNAEFDGDWELTLAAYNAGPGRVRTAVTKNQEAGLPTDYWSLDLPRETMNYVPKLVALVSLIKQPGNGGFDMPNVLMEPAFESIDIGSRVSVDKAAKLADIDEEILRSLNAGLIHGVTAPDGPHHLLIPVGTGEQIQQAFANVDRATLFAEPKTHEVVAGDTISSIALKYGLSQRALLTMNALDNAKIRIGQKLAVLDSRNLSESVIEYVVSIGDTLSEIAHKFSVNVGDISLPNGDALEGDVIHPGDTLNITVNGASAG